MEWTEERCEALDTRFIQVLRRLGQGRGHQRQRQQLAA